MNEGLYTSNTRELVREYLDLKDEIGRPCNDPTCSYCQRLYEIEEELLEGTGIRRVLTNNGYRLVIPNYLKSDQT